MHWATARVLSKGLVLGRGGFAGGNKSVRIFPRDARTVARGKALAVSTGKDEFEAHVQKRPFWPKDFFRPHCRLLETPGAVAFGQLRRLSGAATLEFNTNAGSLAANEEINAPEVCVLELKFVGECRSEQGQREARAFGGLPSASAADAASVQLKTKGKEKEAPLLQVDASTSHSGPLCAVAGTEEGKGESEGFREGTGVFSGYCLRFAGTMSSSEALEHARARGLQLLLLRPLAKPPLCVAVDSPGQLLRSVSQETLQRELRRRDKKRLLEQRKEDEARQEFSFDPSTKPKTLRLSTAAASADELRLLQQIRLHLQQRRRVDLQIVSPAVKPSKQKPSTSGALARVARVEQLVRRVVFHCRDIAKPSNLPLYAAPLEQQPAQKFSLLLKLCPCTPEQAASFRVPSLLSGVARCAE